MAGKSRRPVPRWVFLGWFPMPELNHHICWLDPRLDFAGLWDCHQVSTSQTSRSIPKTLKNHLTGKKTHWITCHVLVEITLTQKNGPVRLNDACAAIEGSHHLAGCDTWRITTCWVYDGRSHKQSPFFSSVNHLFRLGPSKNHGDVSHNQRVSYEEW